MSIDIFSTRAMLNVLEQNPRPTTFLLDMFFKDGPPIKSQYVDIDIIKGGQKMAPFVSPLAESTVVTRPGYTTNSIQPPFISLKMKTTAVDFLRRLPGQNSYAEQPSSILLAAQQMGRDLATLEDMMIRREEYMAAQLLDTGIVTVTGDGVNATIDFKMPAAHKIAVGDIVAWDNSSADPLENLREWCLLINTACGLVPDVCIMSPDVQKCFLDNEKLQKLMNMLKVNSGEIKPSLLPEKKASYLGYLSYPGMNLDVYSYTGSYVDDNGVTQFYLPSKTVWLGCRTAHCIRQYGAVYDISADGQQTGGVKRLPKSWETNDPSCRWVQLKSSPLPCLHQSDAFLSAKVLA